MFRSVVPSDTAVIVSVCESTGIFPPEELGAIETLLADYHARTHETGHEAVVLESDGHVIAVAYLVPKELTDRTWELLMMMVAGWQQGQGHGTRLLQEAEVFLLERGCRLLLIETSSVPEFARTREFYRKNGYAEVATVPDYYADGVGKVSFVKKIAQETS